MVDWELEDWASAGSRNWKTGRSGLSLALGEDVLADEVGLAQLEARRRSGSEQIEARRPFGAGRIDGQARCRSQRSHGLGAAGRGTRRDQLVIEGLRLSGRNDQLDVIGGREGLRARKIGERGQAARSLWAVQRQRHARVRMRRIREILHDQRPLDLRKQIVSVEQGVAVAQAAQPRPDALVVGRLRAQDVRIMAGILPRQAHHEDVVHHAAVGVEDEAAAARAGRQCGHIVRDDLLQAGRRRARR